MRSIGRVRSEATIVDTGRIKSATGKFLDVLFSQYSRQFNFRLTITYCQETFQMKFSPHL